MQEGVLMLRVVEAGTNHYLTYTTHSISEQSGKRNLKQREKKKSQSEGAVRYAHISLTIKPSNTNHACTPVLSVEFSVFFLQVPHLVLQIYT